MTFKKIKIYEYLILININVKKNKIFTHFSSSYTKCACYFSLEMLCLKRSVYQDIFIFILYLSLIIGKEL